MSHGLWSHLSSGESKFTKGVKCLVWKQEQVIDIRKHKYSIIFLARSQGHFDTCEFHHFILILIFVKKNFLKCPLVPSPECHNNHSGLYWSLNSHNTQFMETNPTQTTHILTILHIELSHVLRCPCVISHTHRSAFSSFSSQQLVSQWPAILGL